MKHNQHDTISQPLITAMCRWDELTPAQKAQIERIDPHDSRRDIMFMVGVDGTVTPIRTGNSLPRS